MKKETRVSKRHFGAFLVRILIYGAALVTLTLLLALVVYVLVMGLPHLKAALFSPHYSAENPSFLPALAGTLWITVLALLIAVPIGIGGAIYLVEYARRGNRTVRVIRMAAETLAGIPSIVYGLFGLLFFVTYLHWGYSLLAGAVTVSMMILPLVLRATEEALMSVPDAWREGSFGLGAGKLRTIVRIVLPAASPGILAGVILAMGRIVGETAALLYTAGTVAEMPKNLLSSSRTLAVHMYSLAREGLYLNEAYAAAVVLLAVVLLMNGLASLLARRMRRAQGK